MIVKHQPPAKACHNVKKRELEEPKECLSRGKRMVNALLNNEKKNEESKVASKTLT